MPISLKVQAEADSGSFRRVIDDAEGQFSAGGLHLGSILAGDVISSFSRGLSSGLPSAVGPAVSSLSSSLSSAVGSAGGLSTALGGVSTAAVGATAGIAAIGAAVVIAGKQLYDWGEQWDEITDKLIIRTGLADDAINSLKDSVRDLGSVTAAPLGEIGSVLGDVTVSFHQTGDAAEALTQNIVNMQNLLGQEIDTRGLARVFDLFDVKNAADQLDLLDELYSISKNTKIPVDELAQAMQNTGRAAKDLGLDASQTAGLIATLEQAGLSWERTGQAMIFAVRSAAKSHQDLDTYLANTVTRIQELNAAGKENEAIMVAQAAFGGRGYIDMYNAISTYKLGVDDLTRAFDEHGSTIAGDIARTQDWDEAWKKFTNTLSGLVQPAATGFFNYVSGFLSTVTQLTDSWTKAWDNLFGTIHTNAPTTADDLAGIQAGLGTGPFAPGAPGSQAPLAPSTAADAWANTGGVPTSPPQLGGWRTPQGWNRNDTTTSGRADQIEVPYGPGYGEGPQAGETTEQWQKRQQLLADEHDLQEAQARLEQVRADNNSTQNDIVRAENTVEQAKQRLLQDQLRTGPTSSGSPQVPYGPGYGAPPRAGETSDQYSREQAALEATHKRQQAEAQLDQVRATAGASQNDIIKAENDLRSARQDEYQAMLRLNDSSSKAADQLGEVGAKLDADFGLSEGLPGLAENLFKFLANLAAAPILGAMGGAVQGLGGTQGGQGLFGIMGALGANTTGTSTGVPGEGVGTPSGVYNVPGQQGAAATVGASIPYGLSSSMFDANGNFTGQFPPEIMALASAFGLTPSTYAGHQSTATSAHSQLGVPIAPNPQGLNRGIDWTGSQADMDRFAQFLISSGYPGLEQVIHRDPNTGRDFSYPAGVNYPFGEETGMVHTRFSSIPGLPAPGQSSGVRANQQTGRVTGSANLIQALQQAGIDPRMYPLIQAFAVAEGNNPLGIPTLGFTDSQAGPTLDLHAQALAQQLRDRQSVAGLFPYGGSPQEQASWMATVVGQTGVQSDWQGRAQPPRDSYIGSIVQNWPGMQGGGAVPIIAHEGEHMLTAGDVSAMGGQGAVYAFRSALHMQSGGPVDNIVYNPAGPLPGPSPIGGAEPYSGQGPGAGASGQGLGNTGIGGAAASAGIGAGAAALDAMAPGAGTAAAIAINIGIQEITRAIGFGAQAAGIGVQGLMDTFLPAGASDLANRNWITRIAGGIAGARPQLPNIAGQLTQQAQQALQQPLKEQGGPSGMQPTPTPPSMRDEHLGTGQPPGPQEHRPAVHIENMSVVGDGNEAANTIAQHQMAAAAGAQAVSRW